MIKSHLFFGVALMGLFASLVTPAATVTDLSAQLDPIVKQNQVPGMAVAVIHNGHIIAQGVSGVRKRGVDMPLAFRDRFHLGSCTKAMTATLLARLVEEKKLSWGSTLGQVFPEYKAQMHPQWQGVTLTQLLTNRSGAPTSLDRDGLWGKIWNLNGPLPQQRLELLKGVVKHPPEKPPGTHFIYSNAGFTMAGSMAEKVTGKPWETLMQEKIFKPLNMTSAGFGPPGQAQGILKEPWGHNSQGKPIAPGRLADNPLTIGPAGTVHASLTDWSKFIALHLRGEHQGWHVNGKQVLSATTFKRLHTPFVPTEPKYAYGWGVAERSWAGGPTLSHSGSNTMWFVVCWLAPAKNAAVLVASNQGGDLMGKANDQAASMAIRAHIDRLPVIR